MWPEQKLFVRIWASEVDKNIEIGRLWPSSPKQILTLKIRRKKFGLPEIHRKSPLAGREGKKIRLRGLAAAAT
jgi:hypothetical protein